MERKTKVLNFLALCEKIRNLWRKHKSTAVVPLDELDNDFCSLVGLVFVEEVS
jgi:hypothetical protein